MKTKNSNRSPRDSTQGLIRYCNYFIEFPGNFQVEEMRGEIYQDSTHIAGGLVAWIKNTALYKSNIEAARKLMQTGEYHWKDQNGALHRMVISETPVERRWGLNKQNKHVSKGSM